MDYNVLALIKHLLKHFILLSVSIINIQITCDNPFCRFHSSYWRAIEVYFNQTTRCLNCYATLLTPPSIHRISDGEAGDPGLHVSDEVESTCEELDNPDANGCGKTGVSTVTDQDYWHYTEGTGGPLKFAFIWWHSTVRWRSQSAVSYLPRNVSWGSSSWQGEIDDGQMTVLFPAYSYLTIYKLPI